jgi:hypothetical protein
MWHLTSLSTRNARSGTVITTVQSSSSDSRKSRPPADAAALAAAASGSGRRATSSPFLHSMVSSSSISSSVARIPLACLWGSVLSLSGMARALPPKEGAAAVGAVVDLLLKANFFRGTIRERASSALACSPSMTPCAFRTSNGGKNSVQSFRSACMTPISLIHLSWAAFPATSEPTPPAVTVARSSEKPAGAGDGGW